MLLRTTNICNLNLWRRISTTALRGSMPQAKEKCEENEERQEVGIMDSKLFPDYRVIYYDPSIRLYTITNRAKYYQLRMLAIGVPLGTVYSLMYGYSFDVIKILGARK